MAKAKRKPAKQRKAARTAAGAAPAARRATRPRRTAASAPAPAPVSHEPRRAAVVVAATLPPQPAPDGNGRRRDELVHDQIQFQQQLIENQVWLEESRDRYVDLYDFAPVGYVTLSRHGIIQDLNLTGASLLGVVRNRAIGAPLLVYIDEADRYAFLKHLQHCREGRCPTTTELTLRTRAGLKRPVEMTSTAEPDSPNRLRTVLVDLSERRQAEAKLQASHARLRAMAVELSLAEERERRRISNALHDNIGQVLALARIKLGSLRKKQADNPDLRRVMELLDEAISQTRSLTLELSPPVLYTFGLDAALEWLAERMRGQGLDVQVRSDGRRRVLPDDIKVFLFQAVRELLTNVVKHAQAKRARVLVATTSAGTEITVEDDGIGFSGPPEIPWASRPPAAAVTTAGDSGGFGLFSIRSRVQYLGGRLDFERRTQGGTRVTLLVPARPPNGTPGGGVSSDRAATTTAAAATTDAPRATGAAAGQSSRGSSNGLNGDRAPPPSRPAGPTNP
jgi:PAS domain S-box-containing protein